jgi:hypothetical protein
MIKQRQLLGADSKKFCKYFPNSVDRKPQTPVFMLSSSHLDFIIGAFKFLGHSVSSAFLIHCLKHDWVEGSNLCLEFFKCYPPSFDQMHEPLLEGIASMNVVSRGASMVLASEVGLVPVGVRWLQKCQGFWSYMSDAQ